MKRDGLVKSSTWLTAASLLSKLLGFAREVAMAGMFGTGAIADAYRTAHYSVVVLVHLIVGPPLEDSLIPILHAWQHNKKEHAASLLERGLLYLLVFAGLILSAVFVLFPGIIALIFVPGFKGDALLLTKSFIRITGICLPFYIAYNYQSTLLSSRFRFTLPGLRALIMNVFLIGGLYTAWKLEKPVIIAGSFSLSHLFMAFLFWFSLRSFWKHRVHITKNRLKIVLNRYKEAFMPLLGVTFLYNLIFLSDRMVLSFFQTGSIAAMEYARFIVDTPLVTVGYGVTQVMLPFFSRLSAQKDESVPRHIGFFIMVSLFVMLPLAVILFVFAPEILTLLYQRGKFDADSLKLTIPALKGFAPGMWAAFSALIVQKIFFAQNRQREVSRYFAASFLLNVVLNIALGFWLGVFGVCIATSLSWVILWFFLVLKLSREYDSVKKADIAWFFACSAVFMVFCFLLRAWADPVPAIIGSIAGGALCWPLMTAVRSSIRIHLLTLFGLIKSLVKKA